MTTEQSRPFQEDGHLAAASLDSMQWTVEKAVRRVCELEERNAELEEALMLSSRIALAGLAGQRWEVVRDATCPPANPLNSEPAS